MKIGLIQTNATIGDLDGNAARIVALARRAAEQGAELCLAPELSVLGYPPRDLLFVGRVVEACRERTEALARELADGPPIVIGTVQPNPGAGKALHNCAALLRGGVVEAVYAKRLLPTYDVFDETRYFEPGPEPLAIEVGGKRIGVTVCEDIWNDEEFWKRQLYESDPLDSLPKLGADLLVNISASPFSLGKQATREAMLGAIAKKYGIPALYVNQVGGNDDILFDGRSFGVDATGALVARASGFVEDLLVFDPFAGEGHIAEDDFSEPAEAWRALTMGARDYLVKTGFTRALLGLSGGVDSSLTAAVAVESLGRENVLGVLMPSPFTSRASIEDAEALAANLGIRTLTLPIEPLMTAFDDVLEEAFAGYERDVTEENLQARIRGNLLMALSNKYDSLLLSTGNKSEMAVGYSTIYGDMSGGLAVISDVPKTLVYAICRWLNERGDGEVVPQRVIDKAPSAELRPDQTDQDALPPYDALDPILHLLIERHLSPEEIAAKGHDLATAEKVYRLVRTAEFKRRQAPPGLKITSRAFGVGWRMPIASKPII